MTLVMTRRNAMTILIAVVTALVALASVNAAHASGVMITGHVIDFNPTANTFIAIISVDGEYTRGVIITADHKLTEDALSDNDSDTFDGTMEGNTLVVNDVTFTYTTINQSITISGDTLDGVKVQFNNPVHDGNATLIKSANAYVTNGVGYIIQDNAVITYTVFAHETFVHIYLPLVQN